MQKKINRFVEKIFGKGCEPEAMFMDATRALAYFGLGVTVTGVLIGNTVWMAGLILTTLGFAFEFYYWSRNKNKKRKF
jgi:hypothetical protein